MRRIQILASALLILVAFAAQAHGQVISLLVGNQLSSNALDYYAFPSGAYQGPFAGPGTAPPGTYFFTYGPNNDLFWSPNASPSPVIRANGMTGNFISTFIATGGGPYTFGPDGNLYRVEGTGNIVRRYNGSTGQLIDIFISSNLGAGGPIHFGPGGDLFIGDGISANIKRFNGTTGAFLGNFTEPGAGGLGSALDFLFTSDARLLVTGAGDRVLQFNANTGELLGVFAQGNGLNGTYGITIGPDGDVYVSSTLGNSIKRFEFVSGTFLGNYVTTTAHPAPSIIQFTPFPIPEPSSVVLSALGGCALVLVRRKRVRTVRLRNAVRSLSC